MNKRFSNQEYKDALKPNYYPKAPVDTGERMRPLASTGVLKSLGKLKNTLKTMQKWKSGR